MSPALFLFLGIGLLFLGIVLALSLVGVLTEERRGMARTLSAIQAIDSAPQELRREIEKPFYERVLIPLGDRMVSLGRTLVRADTATKLQYRLDIAGNPPSWDVNRILGIKALSLLVLGVLTFLYVIAAFDLPLIRVFVITAIAGAIGFVLPNVLLFNAGQKREEQMQRALPDALDLMTISVEAGLGFDAALQRVARETTGPLAAEFARLTQEMQLGSGRTEAMRNMADRSTLKDLKSFALAMVQADSFGIPIGRVLRVQAQEMRVRRRQLAEEKAQRVPVKILFPLVFFILPSLFIVVLGPVVIELAEFFQTQS
jgi:tight adherence protein C